MRKLYREFFYIPKHGKIREKVMLMRVVMTVAITIFCLAAMGITAYAYFAYNVTSASNVIKAATFETNVNIQITDENGEAVEVITSNYKSHVATLKANTTYFVTLKPTDKSTAETGFVIVTADGCDKSYHTQQLGVDGDTTRPQITFSLILGADTKVTFLAHWGTSSYYGYKSDSEQYIKQGETVQIPVNGAVSSTNQEEDGNKEPTTPETTTPTEVVHTAGSGETLSKIAELYNTTTARIAAYNNIADPNNIQAGQTLKIPPADWVMPENTTTQSTTPTETTPPETTGTSEPTNTTEPSSSTSEDTTQTTEPAATENTSTEASTETQPATETTETTDTTGAPTTEANE